MKNRILQEKLKTFDDAELNRCYRECFESPAGQLVLEDMRNRCYMFDTTNGATEKEGARMVVLMIETRLQPEDTVTP